MQRFAGFALTAAAALAVTLAAGAPAALAQGADGHGARMWLHFDLNRDGAITVGEAAAVRALRFLRWDGDGDGVVTEAEMLAAAQARVARRIAKRFARMDRNGDGRLERAEFDDHGAVRFARLDSDGDDRISGDEIRAWRHQRRQGWHHDLLPDN